MIKKIIYYLFIILLVTSCSNTYDSVKRGLTGQKAKTTDEFFVKKKDPLILPPDYQNLPTPDESVVDDEEISVFKETLQTSIEENSTTSSSVENSILRKIRSK